MEHSVRSRALSLRGNQCYSCDDFRLYGSQAALSCEQRYCLRAVLWARTQLSAGAHRVLGVKAQFRNVAGTPADARCPGPSPHRTADPESPIVRGRNRAERVQRVVTFSGQSLTVPARATALLKISSDATESFDPEDQHKIAAGLPAGTQLEGRAQGIAMPFGKGRVVVFGEAAMLSAQVATLEGQSFKVGINVPGNDNRQFALNAMHSLAGLDQLR